MKQKRILGFLPALCLLALPVLVQAQTITVGDAIGEFNQIANVPITLSSDSEQQVQGIVVVVQWDGAAATGVDLIRGAALGAAGDEAGADTVVRRVESDFVVLGVVMDSDPTDNGEVAEVIPVGPGADADIATLQLQCGADPGGVDSVVTQLELVDDTHAAAEGGPALDNVVVVGGLSIGAVEGLNLDSGELSCIPSPDRFLVDPDAEIGVNIGGGVRILMNNNNEVEGFVVSVCHNGDEVSLSSIGIGDDAAQADFTATEIDPAVGGAFGVVIDLVDPMADPPNIDPGAGQHIATYNYVNESLSTGDTTRLEFCDGVIGDPLKDNLIVVAGRSITRDEGLFADPADVPVVDDVPPPPRESICDDGIDNDRDGLTDLDDPDCQTFDFDWELPEDGCVVVGIEVPTKICLTYNAPSEAALGIGGGGQDDLLGDSPIVSTQGFSLGWTFDCSKLKGVEEFDVSGTILETVGAEFVGVQADNDPEDVDGDGCSLVLAVLVDALPPFDGGVIPGLSQNQKLGCLSVCMREGVGCGDETTLTPEDGVNGRGKVPVRNLISVDNLPYSTSVRPLCVRSIVSDRFFRGDCNFTGRGERSRSRRDRGRGRGGQLSLSTVDLQVRPAVSRRVRCERRWPNRSRGCDRHPQLPVRSGRGVPAGSWPRLRDGYGDHGRQSDGTRFRRHAGSARLRRRLRIRYLIPGGGFTRRASFRARASGESPIRKTLRSFQGAPRNPASVLAGWCVGGVTAASFSVSLLVDAIRER